MPTTPQLEQQILEFVGQSDYRPVKPKVLIEKMGIPEDALRDVKRAIKKLIKDGQLTWGKKHLILRATPGQANDREVTGIFRRAMAGFGFVTPDSSHPLLQGADLFIPLRKTGDAADGDRVRAKISRTSGGDSAARRGRKPASPRRGEENSSDKQRFSGRIVEVVERRTNQFVGSYFERDGFGLVQVDGGVFETDILVGDAAARNCRIGDKVVIELVRFPSNRFEGEGVIVEVLGPRGEPGIDTLTIIREFGLPEAFDEAVLDNARQAAAEFDDEEVPADRTDFTAETVVTIDPATARDFDDAISLQRLDNGHWRLGVHIADVSHFVQPNTPLDNEAYERATSVYLPDKVIPMLPEIISNNLASLQPNRNRYSTTAVIEFTEDGAPVATELHRGVINSAHRFTYEEIDSYLEDDKPWKQELSPDVFDLVRRMHTLAMVLRQRRLARGAIELTLPEVKIELDDSGRACGARQVEHTESHQIIEEFMLAANEAVARELADRELILMRRIHEPPSPQKLKELNSFVQGMGIDAGSLQDRFELKRVVAAAEGRPEEHAIHFAVLRSMQKAIYSPKEAGHFALASNEYCHFTSPIRRYPDLIIHRMVASLIEGKKPATDFEQLTRLGNHCSQREQRAEQAERNLIKLKLLNLLLTRLDEEFEAVVTGVESFGLFAQLQEIPVDGMIPVEFLPADRYQYDRDTRTLSGYRTGNLFRLGDRLRVSLRKVDPDRRELVLNLLEKLRPQGRPPRNSGETQSQAPPKKSGRAAARPAKTRQAAKPRRAAKPAEADGTEFEFGSSSKRKKKSKKKVAQAKEPRKRKSKAAAKSRLKAAQSGRPSSRRKKKKK